ncbi:MAG TPA: hypothetical protein VMI10_12830 [Terriglobales bacterium]|nr:hypothetical protein [Terriglobales bacterium]
MKLLVVGSCTGEKDVRDCPYLLTEADFDDPAILLRREAELSRWAQHPVTLYTGWQHCYMIKGVNAIRRTFGLTACAVKIISAGYGLVSEDRSLVPYEATFQHKRSAWIKERAQRLGIPQALRQAIRDFEAVVFLLGKEYLLSTHLPLESGDTQRHIFLTSNTNLPFHPSSTIVPAGLEETRFGAGVVALKGKMFELFAYGLCGRPEAWSEVLTDPTARTFLRLVEAGRGQA